MKHMLIGSFFAVIALFSAPSSAIGQEVTMDTIQPALARVLEVINEESRRIPGTNVPSVNQTLRAEIIEGPEKGDIITVENDYFSLKQGDKFYLTHIVNDLDGADWYTVSGPYRLPSLLFFVALFVVTIVLLGGKQGIRGLLSLIGSLFVILYILVPGILDGYSPLLVSIAVSSLIIIFGSYLTHGLNRTTSAAVVGMLITVVLTGALSYLAIAMTSLTGVASEEAVYLNFNTSAGIDLSGLLLGGILIGLLGVLYDIAIGQAIAVEELMRAGKEYTKKHVYTRAIRIGREHIGALVNTLAIAYVGASLPLMLLYATSKTSIFFTINQEIFATEILRTLIGSIGVMLAVPITTMIATFMISARTSRSSESSHHHA